MLPIQVHEQRRDGLDVARVRETPTVDGAEPAEPADQRRHLRALLIALLEPTATLRALEAEGDLTACLALMEELNPVGAACVIEATHTCMTIRGIRKPDLSKTH